MVKEPLPEWPTFGLAEDVRDGDLRGDIQPILYQPYPAYYQDFATFLVRSDVAPERLARDLHDAVKQQVMQFLVSAKWIEGEASDPGADRPYVEGVREERRVAGLAPSAEAGRTRSARGERSPPGRDRGRRCSDSRAAAHPLARARPFAAGPSRSPSHHSSFDLSTIVIQTTKARRSGPAATIGGLYDDAVQAKVHYLDDPVLNDALTSASKVNVYGGEAWIFSRGKSRADITPLYAATLARYAYVKFGTYDPLLSI